MPLLNLQVYLGMQRNKSGHEVMEPVLLDCTVKLFTVLCLERTLESAEVGPLSSLTLFHRLLNSGGCRLCSFDCALLKLNYRELIKQRVSKPCLHSKLSLI